MITKDRTAEYRQAVETAVNRSGVLLAQPLFPAPSGPVPTSDMDFSDRRRSSQSVMSPTGAPMPQNKTEFAILAAGIGHEINSCVRRLDELAQLAKRQTLFDDKPLEINQLIYTIKQDISKIGKDITSLQTFSKQSIQQHPAHKQAQEHSANVIASLQTRLALISKEFRSVLEVRTQNMREAKSRRDQYTGGSATVGNGSVDIGKSGASSAAANALFDPKAAVAANSALTSSALFNPKRQNLGGEQAKSAEVFLDLGSGSLGDASGAAAPSGNEQTMLLLRNSQQRDMSSTYYSSRANAIESIESTIAELGQVYQHFAQLLAGQREMIQRIDDNVQNTEMNVVGAHNELLRYYENMTSNRWLMIKVFSVIIVFFLLFIFIM